MMLQNKILTYIKNNHPNIKIIEYFCENCFRKYTNAKNFPFPLHYQEKYVICLAYNLLATSRGESPCHDIGGTACFE